MKTQIRMSLLLKNLHDHQVTTINHLTLCMLGNFSCFSCHLQKILSGTISECQTVWTQIRTDILIWLQIVCKGYQQTTKVAASKERRIQKTDIFTKILPFLSARYTILCTWRLQPTCDDCSVRVQWLSSVILVQFNFGTSLTKGSLK